MPLAIEEFDDVEPISDEEPQLDSESEQPSANFPGVDASEANAEE